MRIVVVNAGSSSLKVRCRSVGRCVGAPLDGTASYRSRNPSTVSARETVKGQDDPIGRGQSVGLGGKRLVGLNSRVSP